ncbi:MAG: tripartite tricarboxylate transporter permease [Syntrophaceae bacterium]|nr:tripartite tricarboxylate transporter permease [Syntrophaceae bacterium]
MVDYYLQAFATVLQPMNILMMCLGGMWGLMAGALPGISTSMGVLLLLTFTYTLPPMAAFCLLVAAYCGGITGGAITSILFGIPGEPSSVPTVIEGYALAKQGRAAFTLWTYLICSTYGGTVSVIFMMVATPLIAGFALKFGPPEFFALTILGLSVVSSLSGKSQVKGFLACFLGLFIATVGTDGITGGERFTFNTDILLGGISYVVAMVGLLAVSEILTEAEEPYQEYKGTVKYKSLWDEVPPLSLFKKHWANLVRSPIIGTIFGALPGSGSTMVSFLAYGIQARFAKEPEKIGKGAIEGVMATESANHATCGGAMTILLSLGLPGSNTTAIMIAAFMIHGMQPGPLLLVQQPDIVYGIFVSMLLSNFFLFFFVALIGIRLFLQLNRLPYASFSALILILCVVGGFGISNSVQDLYLVFAFGVLGYLMMKFKIPVAPAILALVLGDIAEMAFRRSLLLSQGDPIVFVSSPISVILLAAALISILYPLLKKQKMLQG